MRIRTSVIRKLIREELQREAALLREAQMQDPLAVAIGTVMMNHVKSPQFREEVLKQLGGKQGDPEHAESELVTVLPGSQFYRQPISQLVQSVAHGAPQKPAQPQPPPQQKPAPGNAPDTRQTIAPPPPPAR